MTQRRFLTRGKAAIAAVLVSATMFGFAPAVAGSTVDAVMLRDVYRPACATILGTPVSTPLLDTPLLSRWACWSLSDLPDRMVRMPSLTP